MILAECIQDGIYNGVLADPYCRTHFFVFKEEDYDIIISKYASLEDTVTGVTKWIGFRKLTLEPHQKLSPSRSGPAVEIQYYKSGTVVVTDNLVNQDDYPTAEFNIADPVFVIEKVVQNALARCRYMLRGYTEQAY